MDFTNVTLSLSILEPLYYIFGWLVKVLYDFFGNYGLAIIFLTVIIRGLLIPLNVKSQKSMLKMQAMSGKQAELQRKYGDDKQKFNEELMKMQKENGGMGFSGCLLPFIQIFLIWPIYRIASGPLYYLSKVSKENISTMIDMANSEGLLSAKRVTAELHIPLIEALQKSSSFMSECVNRGLITMDQMVDLRFLGMDLTTTPAWKPLTIMHDPGKYLPLLVIPILVLLVNILTMRLGEIMRPDYKAKKEAKAREKNNPARAGQSDTGANDTAEATTKMMTWMMPGIMLITTFGMPAAMGLYWIVSGIMSIVGQVITYFLFTKPYEKLKKEKEIAKANAFKKKKDTEASEDGSKSEGKGKKKKK